MDRPARLRQLQPLGAAPGGRLCCAAGQHSSCGSARGIPQSCSIERLRGRLDCSSICQRCTLEDKLVAGLGIHTARGVLLDCSGLPVGSQFDGD